MALALPDNPHVHFFESRRSGYVCNRSRTRPRVSANARGLRCAGSEGRYFDVEDICGRKWQARSDDGLALSMEPFLMGVRDYCLICLAERAGRNCDPLGRSTGHALAARRMDTRRLEHFLVHASITNTVRYTAMSPEPFKDIWR
jgi:hypothetical protein